MYLWTPSNTSYYELLLYQMIWLLLLDWLNWLVLHQLRISNVTIKYMTLITLVTFIISFLWIFAYSKLLWMSCKQLSDNSLSKLNKYSWDIFFGGHINFLQGFRLWFCTSQKPSKHVHCISYQISVFQLHIHQDKVTTFSCLTVMNKMKNLVQRTKMKWQLTPPFGSAIRPTNNKS